MCKPCERDQGPRSPSGGSMIKNHMELFLCKQNKHNAHKRKQNKNSQRKYKENLEILENRRNSAICFSHCEISLI